MVSTKSQKSESSASDSSASNSSGGLRVTQTKSRIGGNQAQRNSLRSLGLHRIGDSVVRPDRPEVRGMINVVTHLVSVEEVASDAE